jgi:hypothetical protein
MECRTAAMKIRQAPMSAEGKGKPLGAAQNKGDHQD